MVMVVQVEHLHVVGRKELIRWVNRCCATAACGSGCESIEGCAGGYQAGVIMSLMFPG